jgi:hypothetical protein
LGRGILLDFKTTSSLFELRSLKDKGQKTKDETYFGVEIRLARWRGIKGEDTQVENDMVSGVLFHKERCGGALQFLTLHF